MPHSHRSNHVFHGDFGPASLNPVMLRSALRHTAVFVLLAGLLLRAATPLGYMPAASGSGFLFELCPGQLPAGFVLPGQSAAHEHHHHGVEDNSSVEPDSCPIGHLLSSTATVDDTLAEQGPRLQPEDIPSALSVSRPTQIVPAYRSRGPPA